MQKWVPAIAGAPGPLYLAICAALARDVAEGLLAPGDRLPPQRDLAEALGVDLGTVTRAYAEARRQGLIAAEGRRGSFVRPGEGGVSTAVAAFDTGMNLPPIPAGSTFASRFARGVREVLEGPAAANRMQYQPAGGAPEDRRAGADWLAAAGVPADEDTVLATSGAQTALHAIASAVLEPGDAVCTAPFVYPGWSAICRRRGVELVPLAADGQGIDPDAFAAACATRSIRALYLVPDNENPTAATLPFERRQRIVEIARRHDVLLIEDDPYARLGGEGLAPLAALAPERTWHVASVSKLVSPALRVAYLRAPLLRDALRLAADTHETTIMPPPINLAVCTQWLGDGTWEALVGEVRAECRARQQMVARSLPAGSYMAGAAGYHLWIPLRTASPFEVVDALRPFGVSVVPGARFAVDPAAPADAVRLSIGGTLDRERLGRALDVLDALLHHGAGRKTPMI